MKTAKNRITKPKNAIFHILIQIIAKRTAYTGRTVLFLSYSCMTQYFILKINKIPYKVEYK